MSECACLGGRVGEWLCVGARVLEGDERVVVCSAVMKPAVFPPEMPDDDVCGNNCKSYLR